jgi:UDP-N-acetylmuramate--alanine ligase
MSYREKVPKLSVPGEYNRKNAAAAYAIADFLGISEKLIQVSLHNFTGTWRRFEKKGHMKSGALVYTDYAHHPTEIRSLLEGAREHFNDRRIIAVFEPHLFSRTKTLFDDFVHAFKDADEVMLLPIYHAREKPDPTVSSKLLVETMQQVSEHVMFVPSFQDAITRLCSGTTERDVVFLIGAGDVYLLAEKILK